MIDGPNVYTGVTIRDKPRSISKCITRPEQPIDAGMLIEPTVAPRVPIAHEGGCTHVHCPTTGHVKVRA